MAVKPIKVSQLNSYIKRILQTDPLLGNVSVIGEVSNLKYHDSGHVYFSLKDDKSKINCFVAADNAAKLRYELEEGMEITGIGYISLYERGGYYSLNIKDVEVSGRGSLALAFEKLKIKLEKEGLFDPSVKKEIPFFPQNIAVVTSQTGAAVKDILKIIKKRNNIVNVTIYPVLVQGPAAAPDISKTIDIINTDFPETDVMIVGRGGGATEELWAFNEEIVARSIYSSKIPVISAVGHETDFTIADFVSDLRAETPTAAAQMAVPDIYELQAYMDDIMNNSLHLLQKIMEQKELKLNERNLEYFYNSIKNKISMYESHIGSCVENSRIFMENIINKSEKKIEMLKQALELSNPASIMKKGYGAVIDEEGNFISTAGVVKADQQISVVLYDGTIDTKVIKIRRLKNDR